MSGGQTARFSNQEVDISKLFIREPLVPGHASAAILQVADGRYLLQKRDNIEGIFYPGFWGLFGGGIEPGESPEAGLRRELKEELAIEVDDISLFSRTVLDFEFAGYGECVRWTFTAVLPTSDIASLTLGEGAGLSYFTAAEVLGLPYVVPYDAFALWQNINRDVFTKR